MLALVALVSLVSVSVAYPGYEAQIPNGFKVPDPCSPGRTWGGVGHYRPQGSGDTNPFGDAFAAEGHVWTTALCQADSDGDGVTNGQELGDPHCHWSVDNHRHLQAPISHPGICEPIGSTACAGQQFSC